MKKLLKPEKIKSKIKVVVDTNVVISAPLSKDGNPAKIFELILLEKIENYTSLTIIKEIVEVFDRPRISKLIDEEKKNFIVSSFKTFSKIIEPSLKLNIIREDISDNKFLECALTAKADYIISGDEHLKKLEQFGNIKIINPKEFLEIFKK